MHFRECLQEAADTMYIKSEVMATAWFGKTNDPDTLPLSDGSDHLIYDPKTKRIRTFHEREGIAPATVASEGAGLFAQYQEQAG